MSRIFTLLAVSLIGGCVVNPKYENARVFTEEQAKKHPESADQIIQYGKDLENKKTVIKTQNNLNQYSVLSEKTSGWSVGSPDAFIHLGHNNYKYLHKINLTLVCNKDSFYPTGLKRKKIRWKLSSRVSGETDSDVNGNINIFVGNNEQAPFPKIEIQTEANSYIFPLVGSLIFEVKKDECGLRP